MHALPVARPIWRRLWPIKRVERLGRSVLVRVMARLLAARQAAVVLPEAPRILVLRFDARLGNSVLLTPLLASLRAGYAQAKIDVLTGRRNAALLASHPAVDATMTYDKAGVARRHGPLATLYRLRRRRYDLCIDACNPTDPSVTHALVARLSGAKATIGSACASFGKLYTAAVDVASAGPHEIDLRLALLQPLGLTTLTRTVSMGALPIAQGAPAQAFVRARLGQAYAVVNLGARLAEKRLKAADYAVIAYALMARGLVPVLTYGPDEAGLAEAVVGLMPDALVAPPTDVPSLACIMQEAVCVISCDTGPMHLAVALGRPTCGLFVSTNMARFGYGQAPHACVDVQSRPADVWMPPVRQFIAAVAAPKAKRAGGMVR